MHGRCRPGLLLCGVRQALACRGQTAHAVSCNKGIALIWHPSLEWIPTVSHLFAGLGAVIVTVLHVSGRTGSGDGADNATKPPYGVGGGPS